MPWNFFNSLGELQINDGGVLASNAVFTGNADLGSNSLVGNGGGTGIAISANGEVTMAAQPAIFVRRGTAANNVTGAGTVYTMVFTTEIFDQNADYDATSTFTAPEAGKYLIMGRVRFSSGIHEYMCRIMVYVNDAKVVEWDETSGNCTGMNVGMSTIRQLSANDTVKLYGTFYYAGWSSTMTFEADSNGYKYNDFAVQRVA